MSAKLSDYIVRACAWVREVRYVNLLPLPHIRIIQNEKEECGLVFMNMCSFCNLDTLQLLS